MGEIVKKGFAKNYTVIDNFLDQESFTALRNSIVGNREYPWYVCSSVANVPEDIKGFKPEYENNFWSWYAIHLVYATVPQSSSFDYVFQLFRPLMDIKSLIRIKEHAKHIDYDYRHKGAVFSLNTCDGFTRMSNGDKVDSVANRMVFFDPSEYHNSSTTSNDKGRYNINFNYF
jgi:hypothetical protein